MIYLIGAGPGNPGLITHRGMELLKKCDAVVYDRLGTAELIDCVKPDCLRIYVGKKSGSHYKTQEDINALLVSLSKKYNCVVRLKGGDPFVFGRGGEEIMSLAENCIPYQVIPGVTSAIAVPELAGIPVTHRNVSRSFHVFTGHTREGIADTLGHIRYVEGTSVFLMGLEALPDIVDRLIVSGAAADIPAAVISNGTMAGEKMVRGRLCDICEKVECAGLASPAIIVVGETASYRFSCREELGMSGRRIGVVGTKSLRDRLYLKLSERGALMFSICNMRVIPHRDSLLSDRLANIEQYSWIGFTSQNGIKVFFDTVRSCGIDYRKFAAVKFAVVGSGTMRALADEGFSADFIPDEYTTECMARGLAERINDNERLLVARASEGSMNFVRILEEGRIDADIIPIYEVVGERTDNFSHLDDMDALIFASASGVRAFVRELKADMDVTEWERLRIVRGMIVAAIGNVTAAELQKYGIHADVVPETSDICGLIDKLENKWRQTDDKA